MKKFAAVLAVLVMVAAGGAQENVAPKLSSEVALQIREAQYKRSLAVIEMQQIEARHAELRKAIQELTQQLASLRTLAEKEVGVGYEVNLETLEVAPKLPPKKAEIGSKE